MERNNLEKFLLTKGEGAPIVVMSAECYPQPQETGTMIATAAILTVLALVETVLHHSQYERQ